MHFGDPAWPVEDSNNEVSSDQCLGIAGRGLDKVLVRPCVLDGHPGPTEEDVC